MAFRKMNDEEFEDEETTDWVVYWTMSGYVDLSDIATEEEAISIVRDMELSALATGAGAKLDSVDAE